MTILRCFWNFSPVSPPEGGIYKVHLLLFLELLIRPALAIVVQGCSSFAQPLAIIICIVSSMDLVVKMFLINIHCC